jgi:hypothetical protein
MSDVNSRQVGGSHYQTGDLQHWDVVCELKTHYLPAQITRYLTRAHRKNKLQDLEKALHYSQKLVEVLQHSCLPPPAAATSYAATFLAGVPGLGVVEQALSLLAFAVETEDNAEALLMLLNQFVVEERAKAAACPLVLQGQPQT